MSIAEESGTHFNPRLAEEAANNGAICPDCRDGKHAACIGQAWNLEYDVPTHCSCWATNHTGD